MVTRYPESPPRDPQVLLLGAEGIDSMMQRRDLTTCQRGDRLTCCGYLRQMAAHLLTRATVGLGLLSLVCLAAAQDKVWRLGLLSAGPQAQESGAQSSWRSGVLASLERNGFRVGSNLELVDRYAGGDPARLPSLAREI